MSGNGEVILGGGLAGLTASYFSGAPVYEADSTVGGVAHSDTSAGFTFDRGIHVLQTRNKSVLELLEELGVELEQFSRKAYIYTHGCYTPYPFQVNTAGLPISLRAECLWEYFRRDRNPDPTNYEEWMNRNIGKGFSGRFLIPYSEKFWTISPKEMTFEWTANRVPQPSTAQVLRGALWAKQTRVGTNADFRYPQAGFGYGSIADKIAQRAGKIHLGHRAVCVDVEAQKVMFSNGAVVEYENLISTIPLPEFVRICPQAPAAVIEAVSKLWTNSILVVNLGLGRPNISDAHWVHFPEQDVSFFRISYPHNFGPKVAPEGTSSVSAEVSYSDRRPIEKHNIVERVVEDLIRVTAIGKDDPITHQATYDIRYAYCVYDKNRQAARKTVVEWMRSVGVVPCGRYGLWTYFWSDEAMLSGKKAAETVLQRRKVGQAAAER